LPPPASSRTLTDWAKSLPYFNALSPSHVKLGTYQDRIYGLPLSVETSVFAWNKDLYKKAGLDPEKAPASWDEITANAEKIRKLWATTPTASTSLVAAAAAA
jgi:multiple sugar transport system substrate-binding protein